MPSGGTFGPLQYYSYTPGTNGIKVPDGKPLTPQSDATFDPYSTGSAGCPGGVYTAGVGEILRAPTGHSRPIFSMEG